MHLDRERGKGAVSEFIFPWQPGASPVAQGEEAAAEREAKRGENKTVLLGEDEAVLIASNSRVLPDGLQKVRKRRGMSLPKEEKTFRGFRIHLLPGSPHGPVIRPHLD